MIIRRKSTRPEAALKWLTDNKVEDVSTENVLNVLRDDEEKTASIELDGSIGKSWFDDSGITAKEFNEALNSIPEGTKILLRINSDGGSVKEGLGIYDSIFARRDSITARVSGYALSIASVFPLAAGKVESPEHAIWMSHEAANEIGGNKRDMRKNAEMLETHDDIIANIYAKRSGKSTAYWKSKMEAESWFTGAQAISEGLADSAGDEVENKSATRPIFAGYCTTFKNIPENIYNALAPRKEPGAKITAAPANGGQPTKTEEKSMNKKTIVALLVTHGIKTPDGKDLTENSTDLELETALAALAKKPGADVAAQFAAINAKLELSETKRVTNEVLQRVKAGKITNEDAPVWIAAAVKDEAGTLAILDKKEAVEEGAAINFSFNRVSMGEKEKTPLAHAMKSFEPVAKIIEDSKGNKAAVHTTLMADWDNIYAEACRRDARKGMQPMNANSISGFTTAFLLSGSLTPLQNVWAPLMAISKDYSPDPYKPLATATLKNPTAASATLTNATNFAQGNSTVGALTVTMNQYTQPFQISNLDLNSGLRMEDLVTINRAAFANKIIDVALTPVTAANFPGTPVISSAAAFGFAELALLQGRLQKSDIANLILDGTYVASVANTPGFFQQAGTVFGANTAWSAFGWNMIAKNSRWTGAGANIIGFACNPQALIGVMGLPLNPVNFPGGIFNVETVQIPGLNISVALYTWWDVNARTMWTSYDVMAGFSLGDGTAGYLVASNTPG